MHAQRIVFVNTASSSGAFLQPLAGPGPDDRHGDEDRRRAQRAASSRSYFVEAFKDDAADTDRNGRVSVGEAFEYAKAKVAADVREGRHILTEHATLDDSREGKLAATLFLESDRASGRQDREGRRTPNCARCSRQQQRLENQVDGAAAEERRWMPAAEYERQLRKAADRARAQKTRAIRDLEATEVKTPCGSPCVSASSPCSRCAVATAAFAQRFLFGDEHRLRAAD